MILSKTIGLPFVRSRDKQTSCLKDYCYLWHNVSYPYAQIPVDSFDNCVVNLVDRSDNQIGTKTPISFLKIKEVANDGQEYIQINATQLAAPVAPGKYDIEIECEGELVCVSEKIKFCDFSEECLCDIPKFKIDNCGEVFPCCELFSSLLNANPIIITVNPDEAPFSVRADVRDLLDALEQFNSSLTGSYRFKDSSGNVLPTTNSPGIIQIDLPDEEDFPLTFCVDGNAVVECDGQTDNINFTLEYPINYVNRITDFLVSSIDTCTGSYSIAGLVLRACDFLTSILGPGGSNFSYTPPGSTTSVGVGGDVLTIPMSELEGANSLEVIRRVSTSCNGVTIATYRIDWDEDDICNTLQITEL